MGIVNVTPDSFSDGGKHVDPRRAVEHAQRMIADGADLVDVGGESTRPGAVRVDADEEQRRVLPVVRDLVASRVAVSVDTMRARTAAAALEAGAVVINDVSGGLADPDMSAVVAGSGATYVVTHWRGHSAEMVTLAHYDDVVGDVCSDLLRRVDELVAAGVDGAQIILDPGLGFANESSTTGACSPRCTGSSSSAFPCSLERHGNRFSGRSPASPTGPSTRRPTATSPPLP
jgi:dihydropteroate synthase